MFYWSYRQVKCMVKALALLGAIGDRGAQGVVLHDRVEGVVVGGGGGVGAHVLPAQGRQAQRLRGARLGVQRAPQVQHLSTRSLSSCHNFVGYHRTDLLSFGIHIRIYIYNKYFVLEYFRISTVI